MLRKPDTKKKTFGAKTQKLLIGSSTMRGWRASSQDTHVICVDQPNDIETSFFGVFDGHGGNMVSEYLSNHLYNSLVDRPAFKTGKIKEALEESFVMVDERMRSDTSIRNDDSGSTGTVVLILNDSLYCANVGDSRAVAFARGAVVPLSVDHRPENRPELSRILAAGGTVTNGRINEELSMSRAFGDFVFKSDTERFLNEQLVICSPDVVEKRLSSGWEFVVLACDGIWEVMSNEQVCGFIKSRIASRTLPELICEELMTRCLFKESVQEECSGGTDNMTVIIIVFLECSGKIYPPSVLRGSTNAVQYICNHLLS